MCACVWHVCGFLHMGISTWVCMYAQLCAHVCLAHVCVGVCACVLYTCVWVCAHVWFMQMHVCVDVHVTVCAGPAVVEGELQVVLSSLAVWSPCRCVCSLHLPSLACAACCAWELYMSQETAEPELER